MKKSSTKEPADGIELGADDSELFGFDGLRGAWLERLRDAVEPEPLGAIGSYEILEEVAQGGQGIVYRAIQPGTNRQIALKRMLAGSFATAASRHRFERETELASSLRHPGIVTIYGIDDLDESPSLAMEWIDGLPITEWARRDAERPSQTAALRTFLLVCDAVQHAHQKGVVHRDLKPSNIIVDTDGFPRVLDFGLAKVVEETAGASFATQTGGFVGTPAYASPEQLDGGGAKVDTRSDVFSLGVLLYEMLTEQRPYRPEEGLRDYLAALDREAAAAPSDIEPKIGAELDAIVLKAVAVRPEDRFQSASALADDLRRYLAGDAVLAHPPSRWYRFKKVASRNRVAFILLALLVTSLTAGLLAAVYQADLVATERDNQREAREDADSEAKRASEILDFFVSDVFLKAAPYRIGREVTLPELIDLAADGVTERFAERPESEARVRSALADLYHAFGKFDEAERESQTAKRLLLTLPPKTAAWPLGKGEYMLGLIDEAKGHPQEAMAHMQRALEHLDASDEDYPIWRASVHRTIANACLASGQLQPAESHAQLGLELIETHAPNDTDRRSSHLVTLALCKAHAGDYGASRPIYVEALELARTHQGVDSEAAARLLGFLADLNQADGKLDDAKANSHESLEIYTRIYGDEHPKTIAAIGDLGDMLTEPEELEEGERLLRHAVEVSRKIREPDSLITKIHESRLGKILALAGQPDEAATLLRGAYETFEAAGPVGRRWAVTTCELLAELHFDNAQWEAASETYDKIIAHARELGAVAKEALGLSRKCACLVQLDQHAEARQQIDALVDLEVQTHTDQAERTQLRERIQWLRTHDAEDLARAAEAREAAGGGK